VCIIEDSKKYIEIVSIISTRKDFFFSLCSIVELSIESFRELSSLTFGSYFLYWSRPRPEIDIRNVINKRKDQLSGHLVLDTHAVQGLVTFQ
jgi:hypothetical protein